MASIPQTVGAHKISARDSEISKSLEHNSENYSAVASSSENKYYTEEREDEYCTKYTEDETEVNTVSVTDNVPPI
jgi:hypothetical protein